MENKTKVWFWPLIGMIVIETLGIWASTQWVAHMTNYPIEFGAPLLVIGGTPIYTPKFLFWWWNYGVYAPESFDLASYATMGGTILAMSFLFAVSVFRGRGRDPEKATSHGTAHWAGPAEIEKTGLLKEDSQGVILGQMRADGRYLRHDGPEHIMVMAPTRSGKGVGIIIPTLLTWPHSVLVMDIKSENWGKTAGFRKEKLKNIVLKFDPTASDGSSIRFNPLSEIRLRTNNEVRDVQNIADMLVDPQGTGQLDHWAKTGHALLVGVTLHLLYFNENATMADIASFLSDPTQGFEDTLNDMLEARHDPSEEVFQNIYRVKSATHPKVAEAARELLNKSENERSSVLSTAMSFLGLYRDPIVAHNTSVSEFKIQDLMNSIRPVSLYLVVPPSDITRLKPLLRLVLNQIIRRQIEKMEFLGGKEIKNYKHRMLLLIDEFPALGRLDTFEASMAYIAGYGLKALLVVQSLNQLNKTYTADNAIIDNCHIRVVYTPNDVKTPEFISKLLGTKTEIVENQSYSGSRINVWLGKVSLSTQETQRALLTPGELGTFPATEEIIFVAGTSPIRANKVTYYEDANFKWRQMEAPPVSDKIYQQPAIMPASKMPPKLNTACAEAVQSRPEDYDQNTQEQSLYIATVEAIPVEEPHDEHEDRECAFSLSNN